MTGNNHLSRRVKVYRRNDLTFCSFFTRFRNRRIIQTDDCRHSARAFRYGFLHELAAHLNQTHRISEINHTSANQRGVFPQAVTGHHCRCFTALLLPYAVQRNRCSQQRWLGLPGFIQFFSWPLLGQRPQVVAQRRRSFSKRFFDNWIARRHISQHSNGLRTLSREHKCKLRHVLILILETNQRGAPLSIDIPSFFAVALIIRRLA